MIHRALIALGLAAGVLLLAGCGGPSPAPPSPPVTGLPPRPATLNVESVDPCTLLTATQYTRLGVRAGHRRDYDPGMPLKGTACDWDTITPRNSIGYSVSLLTNRGAEFALGAEPLRTVHGYAATTTSSAFSDPIYHCLMLVDTGPGQSLLSHYSNDSKDVPGMNHTTACDNAQTAAEMAITNLIAAQRPPGGR